LGESRGHLSHSVISLSFVTFIVGTLSGNLLFSQSMSAK